MIEDLEATKEALSDKKTKLAYPSLYYYEYPNGNIMFVTVVNEKNDATMNTYGSQSPVPNANFETVGDIYIRGVGSQTDARLFVINGASDDDITRVLTQMANNKVRKVNK